jgi:hypothetical protein
MFNREELAALRATSSSDWKISDFLTLMDALEKAWNDLAAAENKAAITAHDLRHSRGIIEFERENHKKILHERAEFHRKEIEDVVKLAGKAAIVWNRILAKRGAKTVRLDYLLDGLDSDAADH